MPVVAFMLTIWLISQSTLENFVIAAAIISVGSVVFWFCTCDNYRAGTKNDADQNPGPEHKLG